MLRTTCKFRAEHAAIPVFVSKLICRISIRGKKTVHRQKAAIMLTAKVQVLREGFCCCCFGFFVVVIWGFLQVCWFVFFKVNTLKFQTDIYNCLRPSCTLVHKEDRISLTQNIMHHLYLKKLNLNCILLEIKQIYRKNVIKISTQQSSPSNI